MKIKEKGARMIKQYFKDNGINIKWWASKHGLDYLTTYYVVNGKLTGKNYSNGNTKAVFLALKKEKIISTLPQGLRKRKAS